jgi:hypothetical protein
VSKQVVAKRLKTSSPRRLFILYPAHAASVVGRPRVIRWIGASARHGKRLPCETSRLDNVTVLSWAVTFGRPVRDGLGASATPAIILPISPRPGPERRKERADARAYR